MKIVILPIDQIIPYSHNAKKHPPDQVERLARMITEFGFSVPLIVGKDGDLIAGHGRLLAAQSLGMKKLPCVMREDLTEKQIRAFRLADNKITESPWDMELVLDEIAWLKNVDYDIDLTGWALDDAEDFLPPEGNEPEVRRVLKVVFDDQDAMQKLFLELRDRGFEVKT